MNILSLMRDANQWIVAVQDGESVREIRFAGKMSSAEVKSAVFGKKEEIQEKREPVSPTIQELEQSRSYVAPAEEVTIDTSKREEKALSRKEMLSALNRAGLKGYQTQSMEKVKAAYERAKKDGRI